ncbi:MAG TPA: ATP-binding protein [Nitrospiria bacterium]|nr:ATP-binding protein [Nitrospiria bacterium]
MSGLHAEEAVLDLRRKLKWLIGFRVLAVTVLLGSSILLAIGYGVHFPTVPIFYLLIGITYLLTILYSLALSHTSTLRLQAGLQLACDVMLETALVLGTGGSDSPFHLLYVISIIAGSMLLGWRGSLWVATSVSGLYGMVVWGGVAEWFGLPEGGPQLLTERLYFLLYNIGAFVAVALLSSSLSSRLHHLGAQLAQREVGLQHLQRFHEYIVQSVGSGLVTTDLSWRFTSINRAGSEIMGYTLESLRGKRWWDVFDSPQIQPYYEDALRIVSTQRFDIHTRHRDGSDLLIGLTLSLLRDERGDVSGTLGIFQDLTQVQRLQEEMRRNEQLAGLAEMAAGIAHEIRNPLASLSGVMQVLRSELAPKGEHRKLMDIALREMDRLDTIIAAFLTSTRPVEVHLGRCDLAAILEETVKLLYNHADYRASITMQLHLEEAPLWVWADADQLRQVMWNLLLNAVQAMPAGGVLTVQTSRHQSGGGVEVKIQDTGKGIKPEHLRQIFTPFFTTRHGGSGLGLSIVHRIVEAHHGRILVESREGQGTRVTLSLPVHVQSEAAVAK